MGQLLKMQRDTPDQPQGETPHPVSAPEVRGRILELLPGRITDIGAAMCRGPADKTLRRRLAEMLADGRIIRDEDLVYRLAPVAVPDAADAAGEVALPEGFEDYVFPTYFDADAQVVFAVKLEEFEFIEWTSTAIELLESYVGCLQRARKAHDAVRDQGEFMVASSGRTYVHPGIAVIAKADRDAQVYREALQKLDEKGGGAHKGDEPEALF